MTFGVIVKYVSLFHLSDVFASTQTYQPDKLELRSISFFAVLVPLGTA